MSSGMPSSYVACLAGQKSLAAQTHYMSPTDVTLKATSKMISNVVNGESSSSKSFNEILADERRDEAKKIATIKSTHETPIDVDETSGPRAKQNPSPPVLEEDNSNPQHESRQPKPKKSKKKKKKHHRRSPSTSSSSSSSSSTSSSSEDDREALKRRLKREKKKRKKLQKENRAPLMMPMMMPMPMMSYQGHPNMNANFSVPNVPQSGQMLSQQITQHTLKATSTSSNANPVYIRDEFN